MKKALNFIKSNYETILPLMIPASLVVLFLYVLLTNQMQFHSQVTGAEIKLYYLYIIKHTNN
jgi:hypothetical protein